MDLTKSSLQVLYAKGVIEFSMRLYGAYEHKSRVVVHLARMRSEGYGSCHVCLSV